MCSGQTTPSQKSEKITARTEIAALKGSSHLPSQCFYVLDIPSNFDLELDNIQVLVVLPNSINTIEKRYTMGKRQATSIL